MQQRIFKVTAAENERIDGENADTIEIVDIIDEMIYLYWLAYDKDSLYEQNLNRLRKEFDIENKLFDYEFIVTELKKYYLDAPDKSGEISLSDDHLLEVEAILRKYWDTYKEKYFYKNNFNILLDEVEQCHLSLSDSEILRYLRKLEIKESRTIYNIKWNEIIRMEQDTLQYEVIIERYCFYYGSQYLAESSVDILKSILLSYGFSVRIDKLYLDLKKMHHNIENPEPAREKFKRTKCFSGGGELCIEGKLFLSVVIIGGDTENLNMSEAIYAKNRKTA